jgi:hypothetical protein
MCIIRKVVKGEGVIPQFQKFQGRQVVQQDLGDSQT